MTATNEFMIGRAPDTRSVESDMPVMLGFEGGRALIRTIFRIVGTALILTAPLMWVLPENTTAPDILLMKLGVSLFFLLCGLALLMRNHVDALPKAYFDPIRRELRILRKGADGTPRVVMRRSYQSLGGVRLSARSIAVLDADGSTLMELPIDSNETRMRLRDQLSGALQIVS